MAADNATTITRNSLWYAFDSSIVTAVMLLASVPVARSMGPEILGHYIFLVFLTTIAQRLANVGIPATAGKYMAEYLGANQPGVARVVFFTTMKYQVMVATVVTAVGFVLVWLLASPADHLVSFVVVASIWPSMVNNLPAQANLASEDLRANVPASLVNLASYSLLITATLVLGWGLIGLAMSTLVSRALEALVRYLGVVRRLRGVKSAPAPADLRRRMTTFSRQNLILLVIGLVVWDRSELLFLRRYADLSQIAFYSLAFSITSQLLMAPRSLSAAVGYTILAQYGRDRTRLAGLVLSATRYVALVAIPMFVGLAVIASPLIQTVYGQKYLAVIPILALMSLMAVPRAFQFHSESLLQATESQGFMVKWLGACAILNLGLDWLLIPSYGALGAVIANGFAQIVAVGGVWVKGSSLLGLSLPYRFLVRVTAAGALMALVAWPVAALKPPAVALAAAIIVGIVVFSIALRAMRCLDVADGIRLFDISRRFPGRVRTAADFLVRLIVPVTAAKPDVAVSSS